MLAYYTAAVSEREREHMPVIGPSVDRRVLRLLNAVVQQHHSLQPRLLLLLPGPHSR